MQAIWSLYFYFCLFVFIWFLLAIQWGEDGRPFHVLFILANKHIIQECMRHTESYYMLRRRKKKNTTKTSCELKVCFQEKLKTKDPLGSR